jgi:uncharacterized protein (TIGR02996 family)
MHFEAELLLDAICDRPDDDTPRLVFADWLQEHGQENYARFIRLQCAAAREKLGSDEANRLWEEIGRVWTALRYEWWPATVDEWDRAWWSGSLDAVHFERGFLRPRIPLTDEQLLMYAGEADWWPWITSPGCKLLLTASECWERLASVRALRRFRTICLVELVRSDDEWGESVWVPDELANLLRSAHLGGLRVLNLSACWLTQRTVTDLLSTPNLSSLEHLDVSFARGGPAPIETMKALTARFKKVSRHA